MLPILVNAAFFAVLYLGLEAFLDPAWAAYGLIALFLVSLVPFLVVAVEYEVYTRWEETFLKFWKTQHFQRETRRRLMLLGIIPIGKEQSIRVERAIRQPPLEVIVRDLLSHTELLIPVLNIAARLIAAKRQ